MVTALSNEETFTTSATVLLSAKFESVCCSSNCSLLSLLICCSGYDSFCSFVSDGLSTVILLPLIGCCVGDSSCSFVPDGLSTVNSPEPNISDELISTIAVCMDGSPFIGFGVFFLLRHP